MVVSLISILVNLAFSTVMIRYAGLGHAGLALSTSAVALFGFFVLFVMMRRRIGGLHEAALATSLLKILRGFGRDERACFGILRAVEHSWGQRVFAHIVALAIAIPAGAGIFYLSCRLLRVAELEAAERAIAGPLLRRLGITKN